MNEYIGKLYRRDDGIYVKTLNNNFIKIDITIDALLAKDLLLGKQETDFAAMLDEQLKLTGLING